MDVVHLASQFLGKGTYSIAIYFQDPKRAVTCLLQGQKGCAGSVRWALDSAHQ